MQVDKQPAPLMSQSEPSPPLQYGMPKDYWKSARDNMNSQIMRTLKTRPPEYGVDHWRIEGGGQGGLAPPPPKIG